MGRSATKAARKAFGASIQALARAILAEARAALTDRKRSDAVVIHDFRRAMKRWRALLRLLEPLLGPPARAARLAARDLAREVAEARDVQSALDAVQDLGDNLAEAKSARCLKPVAKRLKAHRLMLEKAHLDAARRRRFLQALDAAENFVRRWPAAKLGFMEVLDRLARAYRRARRKIPAHWSRAAAEDLHALRQRVVDLRYQMELVQPLWPRLVRAFMREAQSLREALGAHQDLAVLAALTGPDQPLAAWRPQLLPLIAKRQAEHVAAARAVAARLFAESPRAFRHRFAALWAAYAEIGEGREET